MRRILIPLLLVALSIWLPAQTSITVANLAPVPRAAGWVTLVVPNEACPPPPVTIAARSGWLALYGEPWGPRARLVHVHYRNLDPFEHAQVDLVHGEVGDVLPFDSVAASAVSPVIPTLCVKIGGTIKRVALVPIEPVENLHRVVLHGWARVPESMLLAHFWYYLYPGSRAIGLELVLVNSDPRNPAYTQAVESVVLETGSKVFPAFDYHVRRGGGVTVSAGQGGLSTALVSEPTWLGDGQAMAWRGRLALADGASNDELYSLLPELRDPAIAMVLPKHWEGRWGPWGAIPALHMNEATAERGYGRAGIVELYWRFAAKAGVPASHPSGPLFAEADWGNTPVAATTGDHEDFGVTKLAPALSPLAGGPSHIHDIGHALLYEWLRPSYFYNADGGVLVPEQHPNCVFWGLHNHYHLGVSTDRLGKAPIGNDDANGPGFQDWAHMSLNSVYGWAQLTGSHMGKQLLHQIESGWLLGSRVNTGLSEARGWGRSMMAMAWSWCITGDQRIVERLRERWKVSFESYLQRDQNAVVPFGLYPPDPRKFPDVPFWMPWQEALALEGFDAAYWLCYVANADDPTGKASAKRVCIAMAKTLIGHGWWLHRGRWTTGDAIWYDDGRALEPAVYDDPARVSPHWPGTDYDRWGSGAVVIARRWLVEAGEIELVAKCDQIMHALRSWFEEPSGQERSFTRWSEWAATK